MRGSAETGFFFFNDTATTEIYTLSLHDALPISLACARSKLFNGRVVGSLAGEDLRELVVRSEEHTSELQSRPHLVCRLLLGTKKATRVPARSPRSPCDGSRRPLAPGIGPRTPPT